MVFRILTFVVFSALVLTEAAPLRFVGAARWERFGALVTGVALRYESERTRAPGVPSYP